jgi:tripartite-type tricarboxylate transporter receptor subunit TctC
LVIFAFSLIVSMTIPVTPAWSAAKDWPAKLITLIVPWPPGGPTDLSARTMAPKMSEILGVPVSVVNKSGGSGIIGTLDAVKSPSDGYNLFVDCGGTSSIQYAWFKDLPYKVEERTFIARFNQTQYFLIVPASSPFKTLEDLVNAIRTNPSSISFALIGGTGTPDVNIAKFRAVLTAKGIDVSKTRPVTYKGTGEVLPAIAGGHVSYTFATPSGVQPLIAAGKMRAIAATGNERNKYQPDVPTMIEAGFPSVDLVYWTGLCGPPGLPANIVKILDNASREATSDRDIIAKFDKLGFSPWYQSGSAFRKFVLDEGETIKALKLN